MRSPAADSAANFRNVNNNGNANSNNASNSNGVSFGFSLVWLPLADVVTRVANRESKRREGVQNRPNAGNIRFDGCRRTLLAWYRLMVMRYFMPDHPYVITRTINLSYGVGDCDQ